MANIPIPVSIDGSGNITCGDISASIGDTVTWNVTWASAQGSITVAPQQGKTSPFSSITAPSKTNSQWSAVVAAAGEYNISDSMGKQRAPRIRLVVEGAMSH